MSEKKFYRTVVRYEILSDEPPLFCDLSDIDYECKWGGWSGTIIGEKTEEVSAEMMSRLLVAQGSDPEFLLGEEEYD